MKDSNLKNIHILILCWVTYFSAYLCRINISTVLIKLQDHFSVSGNAVGILGGAFFVCYAVGQLINGFIGDKIVPQRFIIIAIASTALLNIVIGTCESFIVLVVCWSLNGYVQSMFWGPMMRILSENFSEKQHINISTAMSTSMIFAFIISWSVLSKILMNLSWNFHFLIPSIIILPTLFFWSIYSKKSSPNIKMMKAENRITIKQTLKIIINENLWLISLVCICLGVVKESISVWTPLILTKLSDISLDGSFVIILIIPIANLCGILLSRFLSLRYKKDVKQVLILFFGVIFLCSCSLSLFSGFHLACICMIAIISAMTYACNNILLAIIPLSFAKKKIVSSLAGIFDFCSYSGAAISSVILGILLAKDNLNGVYLLWTIAAVVAVLLCVLYILNRKRGKDDEYKKC